MVSYGKAWVPAERTNDTIMMKIAMDPIVWDLDRCAEMLVHMMHRYDLDEELHRARTIIDHFFHFTAGEESE